MKTFGLHNLPYTFNVKLQTRHKSTLFHAEYDGDDRIEIYKKDKSVDSIMTIDLNENLIYYYLSKHASKPNFKYYSLTNMFNNAVYVKWKALRIEEDDEIS